MANKARTVWRSRTFILAVLLLAVFSFNNWIFSLILNRPLLLKDGSVSEFSVPGEPHALLFRGFDVTSGILLVVWGLLAAKNTLNKGWSYSVLVFGTLLLGIANIADALFPLNCSETINTSCNVPVSLSLSHIILPEHAYSSIIIGTSYFILPLAGLIYAYQQRLKIFMTVSLFAVLVALTSFLSILHQYTVRGGFSARASGVSQELQMLLIGAWFVAWFFATIYNKGRSPLPSSIRN